MSRKEIYLKSYIEFQKKLDEKIETAILKEQETILKLFIKRVNGLDLKSSEDKIAESFENYLRTKFLDFKNKRQIDKKLKSYKKDLNEKFKGKIVQLNEFTLDQENLIPLFLSLLQV